MINIENAEVVGWEHAIRGMRNPLNSWDKSDSLFYDKIDITTSEDISKGFYPRYMPSMFQLGENDLKLMKNLCKAGNDHRKFMRMIVVYADITAPLYWWKEADTYKVGTVANSCSTMHKIHSKEFTIDDFSHEHLEPSCKEHLLTTINLLNYYRDAYCKYHEVLSSLKPLDPVPSKKDIWWQMIQLLPSSYNQKRTVMLNYEVLLRMYKSRKNHKLDEWRDYCKWIEELPYAKELITGEHHE